MTWKVRVDVRITLGCLMALFYCSSACDICNDTLESRKLLPHGFGEAAKVDFWPMTSNQCTERQLCVQKYFSHVNRVLYVAGVTPPDLGSGNEDLHKFSKLHVPGWYVPDSALACQISHEAQQRFNQCSAPGQPCSSLYAALTLLPKACPLNLFQRTASGLPCSARAGKTRIVLLARPPLCRVSAGAERIILQDFGEIVVEITIHPDSVKLGCKHATLDFEIAPNSTRMHPIGSTMDWSWMPNDPGFAWRMRQPSDEYSLSVARSYNRSHFLLLRCTDMLFEGIRFQATSLALGFRSAVTVIEGTHVFFVGCVFESARYGGHAMAMFNPADSAFIRCQFSRTDRHPNPALSYGEESASQRSYQDSIQLSGNSTEEWRSTLLVIFEDSTVFNSWSPSTWRLLPEILCELYETICLQQRQKNYARGRPMLAVISSLFQDNFTFPEKTPPLLEEPQSINGAGVTVRFRHTVKHTYIGFYNHCIFADLRGNDVSSGSVLVQFGEIEGAQSRVGSRDCSENSVKFIDSSFQGNTAYVGGAIHVDFFGAATLTVGNGVEIRRTNFTANHALSQGGALYAHFSMEMQDLNTILVDDCHFDGNRAVSSGEARPGGAVSILADSRLDSFSEPSIIFPHPEEFTRNVSIESDQTCPSRSYRPEEFQNAMHTIRLMNCTFLFNSGAGICHNTRATLLIAGRSVFQHNQGTALVSMNSNITVTGTLIITNNTAQQGGGAHVAEFGTLNMERVEDLDISDNTAEHRGGGFYVDRDSSTQSTDGRLMYLGQNRRYTECPLQFPSNLNPQTIARLFDSNKVKSLAQSGFFVGSWQKCYGVLKVTDQPVPVRDESVCIDTDAFCPPFDLFYDLPNPCPSQPSRRCLRTPVEPGTPPTWQEYSDEHGKTTSNSRVPEVPSQPYCNDFTSLVREWLNVLHNSTRSIIGSLEAPTSARGRNQTPNADAARKDRLQTIVDSPMHHGAARPLSPLARFLGRNRSAICQSSRNRWTVVNSVDLYKSKFSTEAAWLFFNNATASCYKRIGSKVWYFRDACSRQKILEHAMSYKDDDNSLGLRSTTDASLINLALKHYRYRASSPPVLPGPNLTITPWADALQMSEGPLKLELEAEQNMEILSPYLQSYSDLTLHPAPGEVFDLDLTVTDELLNHRSATLSVRVESEEGSVLLGQGSRRYSPDEFVLFSSGQTNWALSLLGVPGSAGSLVVTVQGDYNQRPSAGEKLILRIPFVLRRCHLGFLKPLVRDESEAKEDVLNFTNCRKSAAMVGCDTEISKSPMTCRCPLGRNGVEGCERGRHIKIRRDYWAGFYIHRKEVGVWKRPNTSEYTSKEFERYQRDPFGRHDSDFNLAQCENGLCSEHGQNRTWILDSSSPCKEAMNRVGPLCGTCRNGTHVLVSSDKCDKCLAKLPGGIPVFVILIIVLTGIVFLLLLYFGVGVTPTLDSWLFFMQAVFCLYPDNLGVGAVFYNILTFGLGQFCLSEDMERIEAKTILITQPAVLFALLFIFQQVQQFRYGLYFMNQVFKLQSEIKDIVPRVLWLCILYSSSVLAYVALSLVTCVDLVPVKRVLFVDGAVECFKDRHVPYAVAAIMILVVFIIPPLIILLARDFFKARNDFLFHFFNRAEEIYDRRRKWWMAVSLARRLAFAILLTVVTDGVSRRLSMTVLSLILLTAHATYRPFKRSADKKLGPIEDVDNRFESFVLLDLCILCVLRLVTSDFSFDEPRKAAEKAFIPLYIAPSILALLLFSVRWYPSWRTAYLRRRGGNGAEPANPKLPDPQHDDQLDSSLESCSSHDNLQMRNVRGALPQHQRPVRPDSCRIPLLMNSQDML